MNHYEDGTDNMRKEEVTKLTLFYSKKIEKNGKNARDSVIEQNT